MTHASVSRRLLCVDADLVPTSWSRAYVTGSRTLTSWVADLTFRLEQWKVMDAGTLVELTRPVWLGGLMVPDAFLAASKQVVAKVHSATPPQRGVDVAVVDAFCRFPFLRALDAVGTPLSLFTFVARTCAWRAPTVAIVAAGGHVLDRRRWKHR